MEDKNELLDEFNELITSKDNKAKSYDEISSIISELFISDSTSPKTIKEAADILLEGDTNIIEAFFGVNWGNLSVDNKKIILEGLLSITNEKRVLRQAIAAQSIADLDKESTSKLVFHIINDGKEKLDNGKLPSLAKYKEDFLRRFFFSPETKWISFDSSNEEILKGLIIYFVGLANDENNFGTGKSIGFALNFAKWIIKTLNKLNLSSESNEFVERYLVTLSNKLPANAKIELQELRDKNKDNSEQSIVKEKTADSLNIDETSNIQTIVDKSETIPAQVNKKKEPVNKQEENKTDSKISANKDTQISKDKTESTAENLLEEKQKRFAQLDVEIKVLTDLILERDSLRGENKVIKQKLDSANDELEASENKIKSLRNKVEELDNNLEATTKERDSIFNSEKDLRNQLSEVRRNLESKTKIIEDERSEFSDASNRKAFNELETFKGKLKQKLRPVFENKRQTDEKPNSENLSVFLRRWFSQIETILNDLDIKP